MNAIRAEGKSSCAIIVAVRQRGEAMEGIQFVTDDKGKKVAVEDFHDQLVADSRAHPKKASRLRL